MTENEARSGPQHPRKNPHFRPPPGVQKALQNFGVPDLRQLLDKKHQEQSPEEQNTNRKAKLPPPDPEYNYLKDPAREVSTPKGEELKKKRQPTTPRGRRPDQQSPKSLQEPSQEGTPKKELRFADTVTKIEQNAKQRGKQIVLENPVNIKVKVSLETGRRSCVLDENTIIPDIKHVPDQKPLRGNFRGFRGRGRGRGSFRGKHLKKPLNQDNSEDASDPVNHQEVNEEEAGTNEAFEANLTAHSITITSTNFPEGEVGRDVLVEKITQLKINESE